ncbi:MAG: hypothetical protein PUB19_03310 [Lachnospiraceae bacterium]|nr:hypothetical protein [Lachnospiraceae bacterium]
MEAIRNYLDALFIKLPDTEETRAAKEALGRKMENRYQELISQGKTDGEAIGMVIAEYSAKGGASTQGTYQGGNPYQTQSANSGCKRRKSSGNKVLDAVMSVYWPTITCLYLIYSFITFDWHISWIIWPIAAVVRGLIVGIFFEEEVR